MPEPPCRCSIGQHPQVAAIDADLRAGGPANSLGEIVKRYGVAKPTLGRHKLHCLGLRSEPTPGLETPPETGERRPPDPAPHQSRAREKPAPETSRQPPETAAETPPPSVEKREPPPAAPPGESAPPRRFPGPPPGCPSKEARVKIIIDLMVENRWETGVTGGELAREWGLHPGTVDHDAAEASRYIRRLVDPDVVRNRLNVVLGQALEAGLRMVEGVTLPDGETLPGDARALSGLASLAKTYALVAGAGEKKPPTPGTDGAARPTITIAYPAGVEPLPPDGDPLQPAPGPGAPAPPARP